MVRYGGSERWIGASGVAISIPSSDRYKNTAKRVLLSLIASERRKVRTIGGCARESNGMPPGVRRGRNVPRKSARNAGRSSGVSSKAARFIAAQRADERSNIARRRKLSGGNGRNTEQ